MELETPEEELANSVQTSEVVAPEVAQEPAPRRRGRSSSGRAPLVVGSYVMKNFADGSGTLLGKIVSGGGRFFAAVYEDGRREELEIYEIRRILLPSSPAEDTFKEEKELALRKKKLEDILSEAASTRSSRRKVDSSAARAPASDGAVRRRGGGEVSSSVVEGEDVDSSTDSSESVVAPNNATTANALTPQPIPLQAIALPPSSGNVGISEESVGCLLSVYSFLRAFSVPLFLSPFGLGDFVGSLNCTFQNSLLDSVHFSLMRALRRHLDAPSSEGSQPASRCLRCLDWALLDTLTWPVYVLEYLYMMGWIRGPEWKEFGYGRTEEEDYYSLPATTKLRILQILCDAVLDSGELRTEIDTRKEADEEGEYAAGDAAAAAAAAAAEESLSKDADLLEDGNSDECRLCGMDGTLICCDGCPAAYHSRCIGLGKTSLPDGPWFCPECAANRTLPAFTKIWAGIRGAEMFGIDPYGRAFVGACNYLLVLEASSDAEPGPRYYDRDDVGKVLKFLCSAEDYLPFYADICRDIAKYWAIPMDNYCSQTEPTGAAAAATNLENGDPRRFKALCSPSAEENVSNETQFVLEKSMDGDLTAGAVVNEADSVNQAGDLSKTQMFVHKSMEKVDAYNGALTVAVRENQSSSTCADGADLQTTHEWSHEGKTPRRSDQDSDLLSSRSFSQPTGLTDLIQQRSNDKSSLLGDFACPTPNGTITAFRDDADSRTSPTVPGSQPTSRNPVDGQRLALLGAAFHPQAYANQYVLGEVAASAAANLVALDAGGSSNSKSAADASLSSFVRHRKVVSATVAMQLKAFSRASARFVWTHAERKLLEGPRERCGWCISCKGATVNKKGCLLNLALSHAAKAALIRGHAGIRPPVKIYEKSHVSAIATHILNMEGHLCGLVIGSLADPAYKKRWCVLVRNASSCRVLRPLLLELEKSIHSVAFSMDWFKLFDDGLIDHPPGRGDIVPVQKRGPGRPRKKLAPAESMPDANMERLTEISWWRGVRLSRVLFQRGCLSRSLAKKAARQGGVKYISGVNYSGNSHHPRTQQLAWRVAVEMSRSASQLALQVRRLDAHIRWKDLVRPEQRPPEMGRGAENEASAFRNAVICGKQASDGSKTRYALTFGDRKHLPSCVMKYVLETETDPSNENAKEKFWFAENNVPLYLIKEHEERAQKEGGVSMTHHYHSHHHHHRKEVTRRYSSMTEIQRRQLKHFRRDIFSYLLSREDNPVRCSCASCPRDLLLRDAVKCGACQGYCHEACFFTSTGTDLERNPLCKQCHIVLSSPAAAKNGEHLRNNSSPQLLTSPKIITLTVGAVTPHPAPVVSPGLIGQPKVRPAVAVASPVSDPTGRSHGTGDSQISHGLVWKGRKKDDIGEQFRFRHVILKGGDSMRRPVCVLCSKDYDPAAMYVRCERCPNWVHAEAVQLEEDQVENLVGFKCGKCRRKSWPRCPYEDDVPDYLHRRKKKNNSKPKNNADERSPNGVVVHSFSSPQQQQHRHQHQLFPLPAPIAAEVTTEDHAADQEMLHEDMDMNMEVGMGRSMHMNMEMGMDRSMHTNMEVGMDSSTHTNMEVGMDTTMNMNMEVGMDVDVESEPPQTYFSFTELLEAPDDSHLDAQLEDFHLPLIPAAASCDSSAELTCETCGVACLPWAAAGGASAGPWKCVACRDWE